MKILVFSDSHGKLETIFEILKMEEYDLIIHLGDNSDDGIIISNVVDKKVYIVKGNCDYYDIENKLEDLIEINGKKIFISHGHEYDVKNNYDRIYYRGLEIKADLILFGHTHTPYIKKEENIQLFNPGSISLPNIGNKPSYGIIEIKNSKIKLNIKEI